MNIEPDDIPFHDARLTSILIGKSISRLTFSSLIAYAKKGPHLYEVWSFEAMIEIEGLTKIELRDDTDEWWVIDGAVKNHTGEINLANCREWCAAQCIDLEFATGGRLQVECAKVKLLLTSATRRLEDWNDDEATGP